MFKQSGVTLLFTLQRKTNVDKGNDSPNIYFLPMFPAYERKRLVDGSIYIDIRIRLKPFMFLLLIALESLKSKSTSEFISVTSWPFPNKLPSKKNKEIKEKKD